MTGPKIFEDTNVLVYAHDMTAGRKRDVARKAVLELWNTETGVVSTQVLQELSVSLTPKIPLSLGRRKARPKGVKNIFLYCMKVPRALARETVRNAFTIV